MRILWNLINMRRLFSMFLVVVIWLPFLCVLSLSADFVSPELREKLATQFAQLPFYFEKNEGQMEQESVKFLTKTRGHTVYFTPQAITMVLPEYDQNSYSAQVLKFSFIDANPDPLIQGLDQKQCKTRYLIGNDPSKWKTDIANFGQISYEELYPGIQALFYGKEGQLEYDFIVSPGADPKNIQLKIEGAKDIQVANDGNLHILLENQTEVLMHQPHLYQTVQGERVTIEGAFALLANQMIGFIVGTYEPSLPLIIDPILSYSTYFGGSDFDSGNGIAVDSAGNVYITGETSSSIDFPIQNAFQSTYGGGFQNAFVTKFNINSGALVYSTYLGGSSDDEGSGIAVDSAGNAYVTGITSSNNFPIQNAYQSSLGGGFDVFVIKLNPQGGLVYSTYLGGSLNDFGRAIAVDSAGNAYVTGETSSNDFPLQNPYQPSLLASPSAFVTKFNAAGDGLIYSTFLGGSLNSSFGRGITADSVGNAYVTGYTRTTDFPVTANAYQSSPGSPLLDDAFVTQYNADGILVYSTYLGGNGDDQGNAIAVDNASNVYVTGYTQSTNFPITPNAYQQALVGSRDAFVTRLNLAVGPAEQLIYSTYLGGDSLDQANGIAIDNASNVYATGYTQSTNFPITPDAYQSSLRGAQDVFFAKLNTVDGSLMYSTYLGGSGLGLSGSDNGLSVAIDNIGNAYITGITRSSNFPTTPDAYQLSLKGASDAFIAKFTFAPPRLFALNPIFGPKAGGNEVVITGINFSSATAVTFGGVAALSFTVDSDTQITAIAPSGTGTVDVQVTTPNGPSVIAFVDRYTYVPLLILPPRHIRTCQARTLLGYTDIVTWCASRSDTTIVAYRVYADAALTILLKTIPSSDRYIFKARSHHARRTSYYLVAVGQFGQLSAPVKATVRPGCCRVPLRVVF